MWHHSMHVRIYVCVTILHQHYNTKTSLHKHNVSFTVFSVLICNIIEVLIKQLLNHCKDYQVLDYTITLQIQIAKNICSHICLLLPYGFSDSCNTKMWSKVVTIFHTSQFFIYEAKLL